MTRKLLLILMATLVFTGCAGKKDATEEKVETDNVTTENNETKNESEVVAEETSDNNEDDLGLYTAFLNNEVEAILDFEEEYMNNKGNSYNLEALAKEYFPDADIDISDIKDFNSVEDMDTDDTCFLYEYIDCGVDGKKELSLTIKPSYIFNNFIIQEKDGKLYIKYRDQTDDRSYSSFYDNGYYSAERNGGICREYNYGYFDSDVNYHHYYTKEYYFDGTTFFQDFANDNNINNLDVESDAFENIQVEEYIFYDDVKSYQNADRYYNYAVIDESTEEGWYDCDKDAGYADGSSVYMKEFAKIGVKPQPRAEIKKLLEQRAKNIGLSSDIIPEDEL